MRHTVLCHMGVLGGGLLVWQTGGCTARTQLASCAPRRQVRAITRLRDTYIRSTRMDLIRHWSWLAASHTGRPLQVSPLPSPALLWPALPSLFLHLDHEYTSNHTFRPTNQRKSTSKRNHFYPEFLFFWRKTSNQNFHFFKNVDPSRQLFYNLFPILKSLLWSLFSWLSQFTIQFNNYR